MEFPGGLENGYVQQFIEVEAGKITSFPYRLRRWEKKEDLPLILFSCFIRQKARLFKPACIYSFTIAICAMRATRNGRH